MNWYNIFNKFRERWFRIHSWMAIRTFGSNGGGDVRIECPVLIMNPQNIHVGKNFQIARGCMLSCTTEVNGVKYNGTIRIGDNVGIREDAQISAAACITIGNDVSAGRGIIITDNNHGYNPDEGPNYRYTQLETVKEVVIGDGVFLGAYCRIAPGVTIGERSVISAGAVVTKNIPAYCIVAGAPGRIIKRYNHETKAWE